jgi:glutathione S-transferase
MKAAGMKKPMLYHIPVCPFSQRVEILLELKGLRGAVDFSVIDITKPRDPALLAKTRGTTALPVLELEDGRILKESLVLLRYFEDRFPEPRVARTDPYDRAVENMLIAMEDGFVSAGYRFVMNQDGAQRASLAEAMAGQYAKLDDFLSWHAPGGDFLFERFGLAECVFTPIFARFWFLDYYEGWDIPAELPRVRRWRDACLAHPAASQVSREEIVKLYYDYAWGAGNGALLPGRTTSSFVFEPHWRKRPWPPAGKRASANDSALGLTA